MAGRHPVAPALAEEEASLQPGGSRPLAAGAVTVAAISAAVVLVVAAFVALAWWAGRTRGRWVSGWCPGPGALAGADALHRARHLRLLFVCARSRSGPSGRFCRTAGSAGAPCPWTRCATSVLRSSRWSGVGADQGGGSHIEHVGKSRWSVSGSNRNVAEPPEGAPITEWWRYAQAATWIAFTPARRKIFGRSRRNCAPTGRPCLFQGIDRSRASCRRAGARSTGRRSGTSGLETMDGRVPRRRRSRVGRERIAMGRRRSAAREVPVAAGRGREGRRGPISCVRGTRARWGDRVPWGRPCCGGQGRLTLERRRRGSALRPSGPLVVINRSRDRVAPRPSSHRHRRVELRSTSAVTRS